MQLAELGQQEGNSRPVSCLPQSISRGGSVSLHHTKTQLGDSHGGRAEHPPAAASTGRLARADSRCTPGEQGSDAELLTVQAQPQLMSMLPGAGHCMEEVEIRRWHLWHDMPLAVKRAAPASVVFCRCIAWDKHSPAGLSCVVP